MAVRTRCGWSARLSLVARLTMLASVIACIKRCQMLRLWTQTCVAMQDVQMQDCMLQLQTHQLFKLIWYSMSPAAPLAGTATAAAPRVGSGEVARVLQRRSSWNVAPLMRVSPCICFTASGLCKPLYAASARRRRHEQHWSHPEARKSQEVAGQDTGAHKVKGRQRFLTCIAVFQMWLRSVVRVRLYQPVAYSQRPNSVKFRSSAH